MPGNLGGVDLDGFIRAAVIPYWHQTCTAKMGRDRMSVVDGELRVYGIDNLRIADGSVMPRVTTGNTMAPCVIIGERAAELIRMKHGLTCGSEIGDRGTAACRSSSAALHAASVRRGEHRRDR
jgi:choline dehydrogenase